MANPILSASADSSVAKALKTALKATSEGGNHISWGEAIDIIVAALDGDIVTDVEFRDIKRILRKQRLGYAAGPMFQAFLMTYYPTKGPYLYPGNVDDLEGKKAKGSGQCAAIVQSTIAIGLTKTWREGIPVRGNGHRIAKGTAVATFEDGFYANRNHGNHVAYYISQDATGITVMDQWSGKTTISSRKMEFKGRNADGSFIDPSNNGDALSVIMTKKP